MNSDSGNVELGTVKQSDEQEYVEDEVTQESGKSEWFIQSR